MSSHGTVVQDPVETYLAGLSRALHGPRRRKADLLAEARDSLIDATEAYEADGLSPAEAAEQAVADFGDLDEVVPGYRSELGIAQGRRTAVLLLLVMIAQPIIWQEGFWAWNQHPDSGSPIVGFLNQLVMLTGGVSIAGGMLVLIATGVGLRYPAVRDHVARVTARFALSSCAAVSVVALLLSITSSIANGAASSGILVVFAFVIAPLLLVSRAAHRCLRLA
ncbi:permease prefix domain 1-containing protein [Kribbella sp. NPDC051620]|uniref:permease prefix domain 1-containing protein n=1 Tax=Kribbella sp. NPDC051620 TaxID=3364120 RepID=UPI0037A70B7F